MKSFSKAPRVIAATMLMMAVVLVGGLVNAHMAGAKMNDEAIDALIERLSDDDWQVRQSAANALAEMGSDALKAAPALVQLLGDDNWFVPSAAAKALEHIGEPALPALIGGLTSSDSRVKAATADVLGRLGEQMGAQRQEVVLALMEAIRDPDASVQRSAIQALANITPNVADQLASMLESEEEADRRIAATALDQLGTNVYIASDESLSRLVTGLFDDDQVIRRSVARTMARIGGADVALAMLPFADDDDVVLRQTVVQVLGDFGEGMDGVVDALVSRLDDTDPGVRRQAAISLGKLGSATPEVIDALVRTLQYDGDDLVQHAAFQALKQMGVTHLGFPEIVNMYEPGGLRMNVRIEPWDSAGLQFVAMAPFSAIEVSIPTWSTTGGGITLSLYRWDQDYVTTVSGTPVASTKFEDIVDGQWVRLTFDPLPAGEYVWLLHDAVGTVGVWKSTQETSKNLAYEGMSPAFGSYVSRIHYVNRPLELFGDLSDAIDFSVSVSPPAPYVYPDDHPVNELDVYADTWVATDGLGRKVPGYDEVGDVRDDKYVGIFYWLWHYHFAANTEPVNVNELISKYPEAIHDLSHPAWGPIGAPHFWNEPLFGFYDSRDSWVLRRHAELLAWAGVDVIIFDAMNQAYTWRPAYTKLFQVFAEAREQGVKTPQTAFLLADSPTTDAKLAIKQLYLDIYRDGHHQDLWFYWDGKPLIMAYPDLLSPNDPLEKEILEFFTFRPLQPSYTRGEERSGHWGWLSVYPQQTFGQRPDGGVEQMSVGVAQNYRKAHGLSAMNAGPDVFGRSYTAKNGFNTDPDAKLYGLNFSEQWEYALEVDPQFIFITGWNEWVAGRHAEWLGTVNALPDAFTDEYSRDIEPTKGDLKDHYYYQMVSYIRRFKGVRPPESASAPKSIDLASHEDEWADVGPAFRHHVGSTQHRDHSGYRGTHYTNTTGRNDIVLSKVARDDEFIYFMVETAEDLTPKTDKGWMRLFIDVSEDSGPESKPNWEGYEFVVNRTSPGDKAIVEASTGGWNWVEVGQVDYIIKGNRLELAIPRAMLGLDEDPIDFAFKWSDNMQNDGDIMDFYQYGDTAPGGRFNYRYFTE